MFWLGGFSLKCTASNAASSYVPLSVDAWRGHCLTRRRDTLYSPYFMPEPPYSPNPNAGTVDVEARNPFSSFIARSVMNFIVVLHY